jgi:ABC-type bacteriocin/lantibiotic exporter with double-glycine peptidase domain
MRRAIRALRPIAVFGLLVVSTFVGFSQSGAITLDVPFVRQATATDCGAACVSMVLRYWGAQPDGAGRPIPEDAAVSRSLRSGQPAGIAPEAIERYLRDRGFRAFTFGGDWQLVARHLEKGRPLIVCLGNGARKKPVLHYLVVAGIDPAGGYVMVNDPGWRKLVKLSRDDFERGWAESGQWTLLAVP